VNEWLAGGSLKLTKVSVPEFHLKTVLIICFDNMNAKPLVQRITDTFWNAS
jgi:hypothetical protein